MFQSTGGDDWTESDGWLDSLAVLEEWHGVEADSLGFVVSLDLASNGLSGQLPANLGSLENMTALQISDNALTGRLPASLVALSLAELDYSSTTLCVPDDDSFRAWLRSIESHEGTEIQCPPLTDREILQVLYESTGGGNWTNSEGWLSDEPLDAWHGVDADTTGQVVRLDLRANGLEGPLPPALGELSQLRGLALSANRLSGVLPDNLTELQLESFEFHVNDGLCAPGTRAFVAWMDGMASSSGPYCNRRNVVALEVLFQTTAGEEWKRSDGWLDSPALGEWYGIDADSLGRVVTLDLTDNGLSGRLPVHLGHLEHAITVRIGDNEALSGSLPSSLAELDALSELDYSGTELCVPDEPSLRDWLGAVGTHRGTGLNCAPGPTDREILRLLYEATDGPNWTNSENWLSDRPLGEWYGITTDNARRVTGIDLAGEWNSEERRYDRHGLNGELPGEIGQLANLQHLDLGINLLTGEIPAEIGRLANLRSLNLQINMFTGEIPAELGQLSSLRSLGLSSNQLTGEIPPALGQLANLNRLFLSNNQLTGAIPPELGQLANLEQLLLHINQLTGEIPPALGQLANLQVLLLDNNQLTGEVPTSYLQLSALSRFLFGRNAGLCVRGTGGFVDWLDDVDEADGPYCNEGDRETLAELFDLWGGNNWIDSNGWLESNALERWHGVTADSSGRVVSLDLRQNGLSGSMVSLVGLNRLTTLRLDDNDLSGRLPLSLTRLSLAELSYTGTGICAPTDEPFRQWLNSIGAHEGTTIDCEPLSDREVLELLYASTGGPHWANNDRWLTDGPLGEWHGVRTDASGDVTGIALGSNGLSGELPPELGQLLQLDFLNLWGNELTGEIPPELGQLFNLEELGLFENELTGKIPPELGQLANLKGLYLHSNELTGKIPPELGQLAGLQSLYLWGNQLTGAIPPELGQLANLELLYLFGNQLTGEIPPELGQLANLELLYLFGNQLTGEIPPELGQLANLELLYLFENQLTGEIPPELGQLANLELLYLFENQLAGEIPPELGQLSNLEYLWLNSNQLTGEVPSEYRTLTSLSWMSLSDNPGLTGTLPLSLVELTRLQRLGTSGTELCASPDPAFAAWLDGLVSHRVSTCNHTQATPATAYLVQAVQSRDFPVPLVAGEPALLRVFVTASQETTETIPSVRASLFRNGVQIHTVDIPRGSRPIPVELNEGDLGLSANVRIPKNVVQEGLEMVVEVDPDGVVDPALGVKRRIPDVGREVVDVRAMPRLDLTLIPFIWAQDQDSSIVETIAGMAANPYEHELFTDTRRFLPVAGMAVSAHEPVVTSSNSGWSVLQEVKTMRLMEGSSGYWMGMMPRFSDVGGVADGIPSWASVSAPWNSTIAHELGHNMALRHAPCGGAGGPDPDYPYGDGSIGNWGYDFERSVLVSPGQPDLMSYCGPKWVSDYHFATATRHRLRAEAVASMAAMAATPQPTLLVWGGADADSVPSLDPAFFVDATPTLPAPGTTYNLAARTTDSATAFSYTFDMPEVVDDEEGRSGFVFAIPVSAGWSADLASITLTGPGGSAVLNDQTNDPMVILRDLQSGQVRAFLRNPPVAAMTANGFNPSALSPEPGLEALFSRGLPRIPNR